MEGSCGAGGALSSLAVKGLLSCGWPDDYVGEGFLWELLNVELVQSQLVHEGLDQVIGGKVEDQAEENGDGQRRERLLEDGEEEQSQTQALQRSRRELNRGETCV